MFNQKGAWLFPMLDGGLRGKAAFLGRSHLSPDGGGFTRAASTAWQRMSTIWQRTIRFLGRSHLSPDGGGFTRAASTAWQRMSTIRQRTIRFLGRSHLSPDGGSFTCAASTAWQRMATVKEQKEKGLLLHPPLRHKPT